MDKKNDIYDSILMNEFPYKYRHIYILMNEFRDKDCFVVPCF
jgi:hypothetical protein